MAAGAICRRHVKNSEILQRCTGLGRNETGVEGEAKQVDEATDCLNRTFCHSRAKSLRRARKPDALVISRMHGN
jgi:hypothetical protein